MKDINCLMSEQQHIERFVSKESTRKAKNLMCENFPNLV